VKAFDVAVIGLGAMGSAALFNLAKRGHRVIGLEQFEPGHDKGSSHGESRAIRLSYFEHPSYVPLAHRAYEKWRELEQLCGKTILTATGVLEAGYPGSPIVKGSLAASRLHGLVHEVLSASEISRRFPAFHLPSEWIGLFQPQGGFLRPELAIEQFVRVAASHGAEIRTCTRVLGIEPFSAGVRIRTEADTVEAGAVIVAAGPWIGELAPELRPHLRLTRQVLGWFSPHDPAIFTYDRCPVFILESEDDACYGFPDFAGTGVKAASHLEGATLARADALVQDGGAADEAQIRHMFSRFMPAANGPLRTMRTCLYTRTPDEDFIVDNSSGDPRVVLASPCSGHGFKFSSVLGEVLADLATGRVPVNNIDRFRGDRFGALRVTGPMPDTREYQP
jgi:sarcosine oxidase